MHCGRSYSTPKPNAHKRKEPSRAGNPVQKNSGTEPTDRVKRPGKLEVDGSAGQQVDWKK